MIIQKVMTNIIKHLPMDLKWSHAEQGFIDQFGNFYGREEAFEHCERIGQPIDYERNGGKGALFSEGLY